jgi:adenine C2-methylase RlmN of 23S rRNA A2503 and tRNA A37
MAKCRAFLAEIEKSGIKATIRNERGTGIDAACGQLRNKVEENVSNLL